MNRLVLIDGNAVLHRAFHAIPPMRSPTGMPVNAVYGFAAMLMRLVGDLRPTHLAVAFDRPAPTFRKTLYKEYQASRPKMDEGLATQIDTVHELVAAFGVPIYELDGYEADDVIGTLCQQVTLLRQGSGRQARDKGQATECNIDQVVIVTGDRDILQLVLDEKVLVYMPTKGLSEAKLYGEKEVVERMGVKPSQIVDYKALAGDSSDNYPGVAGIGPKGAIGLLKEYGSLEGVYGGIREDKGLGERRGKFSEGIWEKLITGRKSAYLSKDLATIRRDAPIEIDADKLALHELATPEVVALFEKLSFFSLVKRLQNGKLVEEKIEKKKIEEKKKENASEQQSLF